jgi:hypothetical protein
VWCSACTGQQHASLKSEMGVCVYPTYNWWCFLAQNNSQKV